MQQETGQLPSFIQSSHYTNLVHQDCDFRRLGVNSESFILRPLHKVHAQGMIWYQKGRTKWVHWFLCYITTRFQLHMLHNVELLYECECWNGNDEEVISRSFL